MVHAYDDQLFIFLSVRADSQFVFRVHSQDWAWSDDKPVRVTISGGEKRFAIDASTALTSNKMSGFVFAAPESTVDLFPDSGPVDIELSGGEEAELTLPPLDSALRQLKECANQLPRVARDEYAVRAPRPERPVGSLTEEPLRRDQERHRDGGHHSRPDGHVGRVEMIQQQGRLVPPPRRAPSAAGRRALPRRSRPSGPR